MKQLRKCAVSASFLILLALCLSQAMPAQLLVLYDNFNSKNIDPNKWIGWQFFNPDQREAVRELALPPGQGSGRSLHILDRGNATTTDDNGSNGETFGLAFPNPNAVTEASFTVTVNNADAVACSSNASQTVTDAEFRGNFFNTDPSPTSQIGDVVGAIAVTRAPTDVGNALRVVGFYTRCGDQFCGNQTTLGAAVLGYVQPGEPATLRIKWDQPRHQFVYQLNHQQAVALPYTVSDTTPAVFPNKTIGIARVVAHCTAAPSAYTDIDAYFDNVFVNP